MAFKKKPKSDVVPPSPDKLLLELPRRKIPDVLPHQREIMRTYASEGSDAADVALQLPTGSGKTLVGLLIAEWRRRKFKERVVYLCPTRQLVNQTAEQGREKYGLSPIAFIGKVRDYEPGSKAEYRNADRIAVTTYSSLFNTNPFFDDADTIILDDAHTAENYIANMWSLRVDPKEGTQASLHAALASIIRPHLDVVSYSRLTGNWTGPSDRTWVDKIPTPVLYETKDDLIAVLDAHAKKAGLEYPWSLLKDHLLACQLYLSSQDILLRPLIPPTWSHPPFADAGQRIYMSATLGAGGDLERLTGRSKILRLPIPEGWERQGVGRRFFMFPGMSLKPAEVEHLRLGLMKGVDRSVVLAPSQTVADEISDPAGKVGFKIFGADDIELSKKPFVDSQKAVAVMANRYDGIDFPGKECRLLFVDGLPRATNSQERFLMSRMGANALFNERVQTRVLQALGRCTRSLEDYSAVVVSGGELQDYLADIKRRKYLHPELQAELSFGVEQSKGMSIAGFLENFATFIENGQEWEEINKEIVAARDSAKREPFPAIDELASVVEHEIAYQRAMWDGDYENAVASAESVLAGLKASELRGYRALWHYLSGSAAWLGAKSGMMPLEAKARHHFGKARGAASGIPWLAALARFAPAEQAAEEDNGELQVQVERLEGVLLQLGTSHDAAFAEREKEILDGLLSNDKGPFEEAHKKLGELLGFVAGNVEEDGSPDPWWISEDTCFVFEDHQDGKESSSLGANKARQAASHPKWIKKNVEQAKDLEIIPVLVSPVSKASKGAVPHLEGVAFWLLNDFRQWAKDALAVIRELRKSLAESGDLVWRAIAAKALVDHGLSTSEIAKLLKASSAQEELADE